MKNSFDQHVKDYIDHLCDEACEAHFRNEALLFEMQEEARCKNWQHEASTSSLFLSYDEKFLG